MPIDRTAPTNKEKDMELTIDETSAQALAEAWLALLATGSGDKTVEFYTGAKPLRPSVAVTTQVLLGTLVSDPDIGTATDGVITFAAIAADPTADADGTVTWARFRDGNGDGRLDVDVTNAAGTGVIKVNTTTIVAGGPIQIISMVLTVG
jgi:hypothetical protein